MLAPCSQASPRVLGRGIHQPLPQVILLNVSGWFLPVPCLGQASTLAAACSINNSGRTRGGGPAHCPPQHLSSSLPCSSSSQAGPPSPAEHPVHPLPDRLRRPGLGGDAEQRTHGAAVRAALPGTRGPCLGCGERCRGSRTGEGERARAGTLPSAPSSALLEAGASTALASAANRSPASSARPAKCSTVASSSARSTASRCGAGGARHGATGASGARAGTTPPTRKVGAESPGGPLCLARQHSRGGTATLTPLSSLATLLLLQPPRGSWTRGGALGRPGQAGGWRCSCAGR